MKFQAVIFDMDGLLIDSELYFIELEKQFLQKYNIPYSESLQKSMMGKSWHEVMNELKTEHALNGTVEELLTEKREDSQRIHEYHAQKMPGADMLIQELIRQGYTLAIASGSPTERIEMIVRRMGWDEAFHRLISVEHVGNRGKPDPAVYLHTAEELRVLPGACIALEDSVNGVHAAKAAGMQCAAVLDPRWSRGDFSEADVVVESLADKRLFEFIGL